jgi:hypothetical protein
MRDAMPGGRASRDKGNRTEGAIVRLLQDRGLAAERVPLSGAAPARAEAAMMGMSDEEFWREMVRMPDVQPLVERAGRRYAASIGEVYDPNPFTRPAHHGGYRHITAEEWRSWDAANAEFQARQREPLAAERGKGAA